MAEEQRTILIDVEVVGNEEEIGRINNELRQNRDQIKELSKDYETNATEIAKLEVANKKLSASKNVLVNQTKAEGNSLDALRAKLGSLTKERNSLDTSIDGNAKRFADLQKEIKSTSDEIKGFEQAGGDFRRNVGNYTESITEAIGKQQVFGVGLSDILSKAGLVAAGIGAIAAGAIALVSAYASSARGAASLARAQDRLAIINERVGNSIADLIDDDGKVSLLDKALFQLEARILGFSKAIETQLLVSLRQQGREIEAVSLAIESQKKTLLDAAEAQRQIRDDDRKGIDERIKANDELGKIIQVRQDSILKILNDQIANVRTQLAFDKNNLQLQTQLNQLLFERADLQEESQGFFSEQLANENSLLKEQRDEILAIKQADLELLKARGASRDEIFKESSRILKEQLQIELIAAGDNENRKIEIKKRFQLLLIQLDNEYGVFKVNLDNQINNQIYTNSLAGLQWRKELSLQELKDLEKNKLAEMKLVQGTNAKKQADDKAYLQAKVMSERMAVVEIGNATSSILGTLSQRNKKFALASVAFDQGRALSAALANAFGPTPDNVATGGLAGIAKYASLAATIFSNVAAIRNVINSGGSGGIGVGGSASIGSTSGATRTQSLGIVQPQLLQQFSQPIQNQVGLESASGRVNMPPIYVNITDINKVNAGVRAKIVESRL